jgi:hypothetical protein
MDLSNTKSLLGHTPITTTADLGTLIADIKSHQLLANILAHQTLFEPSHPFLYQAVTNVQRNWSPGFPIEKLLPFSRNLLMISNILTWSRPMLFSSVWRRSYQLRHHHASLLTQQ